MTRLKSNDIADISAELKRYDQALMVRTGLPLLGIACHAAGVDQDRVRRRMATARVGVIPMTCGLGIIGGFARSVSRITAHIGFTTFVTEATDAAGLAEAYERKAAIVMLADDNRFVAINTENRRVVDNAELTARGYAAGLDLMAGGVAGKRCLVIGCGPVGQYAVQALIGLGAAVSLHDLDGRRCTRVAESCGKENSAVIRIEKSLDAALESHRLVFDATTAAAIIDTDHIFPDTLIAAPGMPLGLSDRARVKAGDRLLHDPLQIGVACMAVAAATAHGNCNP